MSTTTADTKMLRQVLLREFKPEDQPRKQDVFWIENEFAKVGKKLKDDDGIVWVVVETYNAKLFKDVDKQREAWKRWADVLGDH